MLGREVDGHLREGLAAVLPSHLAEELCRRRHLMLAIWRNYWMRGMHPRRRKRADVGRSNWLLSRLRHSLHSQLFRIDIKEAANGLILESHHALEIADPLINCVLIHHLLLLQLLLPKHKRLYLFSVLVH